MASERGWAFSCRVGNGRATGHLADLPAAVRFERNPVSIIGAAGAIAVRASRIGTTSWWDALRPGNRTPRRSF
jgi:hypothetical protein